MRKYRLPICEMDVQFVQTAGTDKRTTQHVYTYRGARRPVQ